MHDVREVAVSVLPSAKPNLPLLVHCPLGGQVGGVVMSALLPAVRTGMPKAIDLIAARPSGGPPGATGG